MERAKATRSAYVLCGTIEALNRAQALTVRLASVANGALLWSKSYPVASADAAKIASEIEAQIPAMASE